MTHKIRVYDSFTGDEYPNHRLYAVAYEPVWQALRTELRWTTNDVARGSYLRTFAYINYSGSNEPRSNRVWRVFNLLCAIPHGQVTKNEFHMVEPGASKFLLNAQNELREMLHESGYPTEWDWNTTRVVAIDMFRSNPELLGSIVKPLVQNRAKRPDAKPELRHYLAMMQEIMGEDYPAPRSHPRK